jgi:hypothetical protein
VCNGDHEEFIRNNMVDDAEGEAAHEDPSGTCDARTTQLRVADGEGYRPLHLIDELSPNPADCSP